MSKPLSEKIKNAQGPKAELGALLVDLMGEYFEACANANDEKKHAERYPVSSTERLDRMEASAEYVAKAEVIESVIVRLAGPVEDLL